MPETNNDSWLAMNTRPLLAIITVLMTFYMFIYFVCMANKPTRESADLHKAQQQLRQVDTKFSNISSSKAERAVTGRLDEVRKERDRFRLKVSNAAEAAEDARDRRGIVKEFIMYILGVLSSALTTILAFYFGSSKGSSDKNLALNLLAAQNQAPPVAGPEPEPATPAEPAGEAAESAAGTPRAAAG
jgi:flagellar basal body-associated protein FliL